MKRTLGMTAGLGLAVALCQPAYAQQQVEWKQTINTPKGLNLPKDVKGDVLGIELGDTYGEAKAKLEKLLAESSPKAAPPANNADLAGMSERARAMAEARRRESDASSAAMMGESGEPPMQETRSEMRFQTPGGFVSASYVSEIILKRKMPGSTKDSLREIIKLRFSAPSSGQQVVGIDRFTAYPAQSDQPLLSDIVASLKTKFRTEPRPISDISKDLGINFDNGQTYVPASTAMSALCFSQYESQGNLAQYVQQVNSNGKCDVVVRFTYQPGISANHVSSFRVVLSDNERTKLNLTADLAFLNSYVQNLQNSVRGAAPKL